MPDFRYHDLSRLTIEDVLKRLETSSSGLTSDESLRRLKEFGPNVLTEPNRYSLLHGLSRHFTHFLAILLWIAAGLSFTADYMKPGEGMAMGGFFLYLFSNGWTWGTHLDWSSPLFYRQATTVTFAGIVLAQVANVVACRSDRLSIFKLDRRTNPLMVWGIAIELTSSRSSATPRWGTRSSGPAPCRRGFSGRLCWALFCCYWPRKVVKSS